VVFTFIDADHHDDASTSSGSRAPTLFTLARTKK